MGDVDTCKTCLIYTWAQRYIVYPDLCTLVKLRYRPKPAHSNYVLVGNRLCDRNVIPGHPQSTAKTMNRHRLEKDKAYIKNSHVLL